MADVWASIKLDERRRIVKVLEARTSSSIALNASTIPHPVLLSYRFKMTNNTHDVVIVGAGPVGLFLACELRLAGLSVLVVEKRTNSDGVAETRAFVMHGRTLEIFACRGLLDSFVQAGQKPIGGITAFWTLVSITYKTEMILFQRAVELGAVIIQGVQVDSVNQSGPAVMVKGAYTDNRPFIASAKYLVGADGVRSTIRRLADIEFTGNAPVNTVMSGEATLGAAMPNPYIVHNEHGLVIAADLKVPSGRTRLNVFASDRGTVPESVEVTLDEMNQSLHKITGVDYNLSNPCMLKRFSNEQRLATRYRQGRVFIVGDACHKHLPAGGQGLNVGLQEALNLGWKIAAVISKSAPVSLLDTYEEERRPIAKAVVQNTTSQSLLFFASSGPEWAVRDAMEKLLCVPEANKALAREISGFSVTYPKLLDMILPNGWQALPKNIQGRRALNVKIRLPDGVLTELRDYTEDGNWIQLHLPGKHSVEVRPPPAFEDWTTVVDVVDMPDDEERTSLYMCGVREMLIRPDGYLAFGRWDN
ncbi:monooxygenase [Aspergillus nomiae NRRL 13137]|uniref:Monooxygenase n=1 Tax=Aspergillus nomiae NRRL (strain ATCC 15546 / NRRL 13137 / CBS 260.88 / M93) TaxID=1509407 RepID=A0A0L1JBW0_ASPN3|nr:monooxygenase [Aspergillus nomiae NRRL 13137]KNG89234.1 monooxygenase [Aspergillus nomiae NRRL 13137]